MSSKAVVLAMCVGLVLAAGCGKTTSAPAYEGGGVDAARVKERGSQQRAAAPAPVLYVEPDAGFGWLYTLVNNAETSLDMTMYELVDTTASADLVQACKRGVKVRVILDQSREKVANTPAYNQLAAAGPNCTVAWSNPQFPATHQKTLVVDGTTAVVMTFNLTSRYYSGTRDMAVIDKDSADVAAIRTTFAQDYQSTTDLGYQPPAGDNLIWSPTTAQADLVGLINGAQSTLLVENEELGAPNIVASLAAACKRGVKVQLAMTDTNVNYHANYQTLQAAGCGVHVGANNSTTLYVHAKAMAADVGGAKAVGYVGSINFSNASMTQNRELGLYVRDAATLQQIAATVSKDFNTFPNYSPSVALPNTRAALP